MNNSQEKDVSLYEQESLKLRKMIDDFDKKFDITENREEDISYHLEKLSEDKEKRQKLTISLEKLSEDKEKRQKLTISLGKLSEDIRILKEKQQKLILNIAGCMYNGVLIDSILSFRSGRIYQYKHQYALSLDWIIQKIEEGRDEVLSKLGEQKFAELQFLIAKANQKNSLQIYEDMIIEFPEQIMIDINNDWSDEKSITIKKIGRIRISSDGLIWFEYDKDKENKWHNIAFNPKVKNILLNDKFEDIEKAISERLNILNKLYDDIKADTDEIRNKCAKYIVLLGLKDTGEK